MSTAWYYRNRDAILRKLREDRAANPQKYATRAKAHYAKHRGRYSHKNRRAKYGITPIEFWALVAEQDGRCAACRDLPEHGKTLHVDHDHSTNVVRRLLCARCNTALGLLKEDPLRIRALAAYAEKFVTPRT